MRNRDGPACRCAMSSATDVCSVLMKFSYLSRTRGEMHGAEALLALLTSQSLQVLRKRRALRPFFERRCNYATQHFDPGNRPCSDWYR